MLYQLSAKRLLAPIFSVLFLSEANNIYAVRGAGEKPGDSEGDKHDAAAHSSPQRLSANTHDAVDGDASRDSLNAAPVGPSDGFTLFRGFMQPGPGMACILNSCFVGPMRAFSSVHTDRTAHRRLSAVVNGTGVAVDTLFKTSGILPDPLETMKRELESLKRAYTDERDAIEHKVAEIVGRNPDIAAQLSELERRLEEILLTRKEIAAELRSILENDTSAGRADSYVEHSDDDILLPDYMDSRVLEILEVLSSTQDEEESSSLERFESRHLIQAKIMHLDTQEKETQQNLDQLRAVQAQIQNLVEQFQQIDFNRRLVDLLLNDLVSHEAKDDSVVASPSMVDFERALSADGWQKVDQDDLPADQHQ